MKIVIISKSRSNTGSSHPLKERHRPPAPNIYFISFDDTDFYSNVRVFFTYAHI